MSQQPELRVATEGSQGTPVMYSLLELVITDEFSYCSCPINKMFD